MKPDWKDSPDWANWLAQDTNGDWYWYENKPYFDDCSWYQQAPGRLEYARSSAFLLEPESRP